MCADMSDTETKPARAPRVAFRSRPVQPASSPAGPAQAAAAAAPPATLAFAPGAEQHGTDRDILMGYQVFLGRDPENSFVINDAKSSALRGFVNGLMLSGEFETAVLHGLARRQAMPHERSSVGPSPDQLAWLAGVIVLPPELADRFTREPPDWRGFWTAMTALPGFPRGGDAAAPAGLTPAAASQGFILITIEQPKPGDKLHPGTALNGSGWAIAPEDIAEIIVTLDGVRLTQARQGLPRPDVARNFPHYRHVDQCGFAFSAFVPPDAVITPGSQVGIMVKTVSGQTGRRGVRITPPVLAPSQSALPLRLTVEDVRVDSGGYLRLRGWALSRAGTANIKVFLGETLLGEAEYGLDRPIVANTYSDYPDAGRSGFVFGASLAGTPGGPVSVRVQLTDSTGELRQVVLPVTVPDKQGANAPQAASAGGGRFQCDEAVIAPDGKVTISGWALPEDGVHSIAVLRGKKIVASPIHGSARPDIARQFPGVPDAARCGFRCAFTPNPAMQPGDVLTLRLRTGEGATIVLECPLADRQNEAAPPAAAHSFMPLDDGVKLDVDTPALDGQFALHPIRGPLTIAGWAVAPSGVAEVTVECDGQKLGSAYLGERREDLGRTFPDYQDALRGGFALILPPGVVTDGLHRFTVTAVSRDGATGTRSFSAAIEPMGESQPGSAPRVTMPRAEQVFGQAMLAARACAPRFAIILQPGSDTEMQATRESLDRQAYAAFDLITPEGPARAAQAPGGGQSPTLTMVLRAGDVLGCDALLELACAYAMHPEAGFIYADDQRLDAVHGHRAPFYKPDWSPELLLNMDYIGRPWCAAQDTLDRAGLTHADLARLSGYDAALRLTGAAGQVRHIDRVLAATTAQTSAAEAETALTGLAARLGIAARPLPGTTPGTWRMRRQTDYRGKVSVIIPTAGAGGLIKRAIESVRETTPPGLVDIVVLDNVPAGQKAMKSWLKKHADRVIAMPGSFNWSRFNNHAVAQTSNAMLLFLNDDIEAREPGWLEAMLEHAQRPEVGVVGARLLYPDGKVQHGGVFLSDNSGRHAFRFANGDDAGPFGLARVAREMSAVTGACQLVRRDVFDRLGGFDEAHDVVNNDVDFCLRAQAAGLSVIFTPHAELMHHELASRALIEDRHDAARFTGDWRLTMLAGDKFHSRRLRHGTDYDEPDLEPVQEIHAGPRGPAADRIERILAVKLDHIGDFITALPALRLLRTHFPAARITLLAPPASAALAKREGVADDILEFTFFHTRSADGLRGVTEQDYAELATMLTPHRFDMAIDLRMHPETRRVLQQSGAPFLVGYDQKGTFPWLNVRLEFEGDERLRPKPGHISERLLALVEAAALACRPIPVPRLRALADPATIPPLARLPGDFLAKRLVCIHPGVGNTMRRWSASNFAALIDLLGDQEDMHAILVGGPDEQDFAREVLAASHAQHRIVSLAGALSLPELSDVIGACALFVGNDSGPKHMAASLGVPTLGIHSAVVDAEEWAPLGAAAFALEKRVVCSPCYLAYASECPRGLACLTGLKPKDALVACQRLLALRPAAGFPH